MKKYLYLFLSTIIVGVVFYFAFGGGFYGIAAAPYPTSSPQGKLPIAPSFIISNLFASIAINTVTSMNASSTTAKLAFKFYAPANITPTAADCNWAVTGATTGIVGNYRIETDYLDTPSGNNIATSTTFNWPTASGWQATSTTFSATSTIAQNTAFWLIMEYNSGTAPSDANYIQSRGNTSVNIGGGRARKYNGTNWTTITVSTVDAFCVLTLDDGTYLGLGFNTVATTPGLTERGFGNQTSGLKFRLSGYPQVNMFYTKMSRLGTPTTTADFYFMKNNTLLETVSIPTSSITTTILPLPVYLSKSYTIDPNSDYYILLHNHNEQGDSSNYYILQFYQMTTAYQSTVLPSTWMRVAGTGTTSPSTFTIYSSSTPQILPGIKGIDSSSGFASPTHSSGFFY